MLKTEINQITIFNHDKNCYLELSADDTYGEREITLEVNGGGLFYFKPADAGEIFRALGIILGEKEDKKIN